MASFTLVHSLSSKNLSFGLRAFQCIRNIHLTSYNQAGGKERRKNSYTLGVTHSWASRGGVTADDTSLLQDMYIRKFIFGTFPGLTQVVQQKKGNCITVTFWVNLTAYKFNAPALYFLSSYSETILSSWLGCKVNLVIRGWYKQVKVV